MAKLMKSEASESEASESEAKKNIFGVFNESKKTKNLTRQKFSRRLPNHRRPYLRHLDRLYTLLSVKRSVGKLLS